MRRWFVLGALGMALLAGCREVPSPVPTPTPTTAYADPAQGRDAVESAVRAMTVSSVSSTIDEQTSTYTVDVYVPAIDRFPEILTTAARAALGVNTRTTPVITLHTSNSEMSTRSLQVKLDVRSQARLPSTTELATAMAQLREAGYSSASEVLVTIDAGSSPVLTVQLQPRHDSAADVAQLYHATRSYFAPDLARHLTVFEVGDDFSLVENFGDPAISQTSESPTGTPARLPTGLPENLVAGWARIAESRRLDSALLVRRGILPYMPEYRVDFQAPSTSDIALLAAGRDWVDLLAPVTPDFAINTYGPLGYAGNLRFSTASCDSGPFSRQLIRYFVDTYPRHAGAKLLRSC